MDGVTGVTPDQRKRRAVEYLAGDPATTGAIFDLDGTLSPIAAHPDLAVSQPGAVEAIQALVARLALVAVVSGRPADEVRHRLPVEGLDVRGVYGAEGDPRSGRVPRGALEALDALAAEIDGAWLERKGATAALHLRGVPTDDRTSIRSHARAIAAKHGLRVLPGRAVVEVAAAGVSDKGTAVHALVTEHPHLATVMYAGDDHADLDAFQVLDGLRTTGLRVVLVGIGSSEGPDQIVDDADVSVASPAELVSLLQALIRAIDAPAEPGRRRPRTERERSPS